MQKLLYFFIVSFLSVSIAYSQQNIELIFDNFNNWSIFNNFSGDRGQVQIEPGRSNLSFDTNNRIGNSGASLKIKYNLTSGGFSGYWTSIIGKNDYSNQFLDFTDLYRELINSDSNLTNIENIIITKFNFWAKGNGNQIFNHVVKVELKDIFKKIIISKKFIIPNTSDWTKYELLFDATTPAFKHMKQIVFVLDALENDARDNYFYLDHLSFNTNETNYNAVNWSDISFLDLISHRVFNYFLIFTDDLLFALDRSTYSDQVSVGAIGFQLAAYCIGHKRNWANNLEEKIITVLENLWNLPMGSEPGLAKSGYKGFYYHFLEANTGLRKKDDTELSLYDTMLLMYGILTCKEYFKNNPKIQVLAQSLYNRIEWNWMVDTTPGEHQYQFRLAWKPEIGFEGWLDGYTDEALLVDLLSMGSNTSSTTIKTYNARVRSDTVNIGIYPASSPDSMVVAWEGSLFNYFFASCWLDLKNSNLDIHQSYQINLWENNKNAILANYRFCTDHKDDIIQNNDDNFTTYHDSSWGITACAGLADTSTTDLDQYYGFGAMPTERNIRSMVKDDIYTPAPHLGTIAVYGAGSSINFLPEQALNALKYYYSRTELWNPFFGFGDAYSTDPHYFELDENKVLIPKPATWFDAQWTNHMIMGINVGPMLLAIENYRTGFIWSLLKNNPNISKGLGIITAVTNYEHFRTPISFELNQNYPNPFNENTIIKYSLEKKSKVVITIYNLIGEEIKELINSTQNPGKKQIIWDGKDNYSVKVNSGIYFLRLKADDSSKHIKLLLIK